MVEQILNYQSLKNYSKAFLCMQPKIVVEVSTLLSIV